MKEQIEEKNELVDLLEDIGHDWDAYIDECQDNEEEPQFSYCDFHADSILEAGYRKQEWLSVDERLPDKWQKCLCYYPEKDYGSKVVVDYAETDNGDFAEQFQFGKPSHWMPLPEPPKMKGGAE